MIRTQEATGKTVDEARTNACALLGVEKDDINVSYEVLEMPQKTGFLGLKLTPAKVRVSVELPDEPAAAPAAPVEEPAPVVEEKAAPVAEPVVEETAPEAPAAVEEPAAPAAEGEEVEVPIRIEENAKVQAAVDYLKDIGDKYDLIILDPPAFAKHHKVLGNAMQGYKRLNARAISQIKPGGILFTFSCSQAVSKELFRTTVFSAAAIAGRKVRILHQLTQPADHPINIYHPEGEYLKGLVLYVE